jgi:imidazolonepropionase-like amidohydrolase
MALLRQLYSDAKWYAAGNSDTKDRSIEALNANKGLVQIFAAGDRGHAARADRIGDANGIQFVILAGGNEFEDINAIKATNASFIVPLKFPDAYDVSNPFHADYVSLEDMRFWNQAPGNPKALADNGIPFAFTLHDLKAAKDIKDRIMKAIKYGLSKEKALEALTTAPARILGQSATLGSLNPGAHANFLITSGDVFDKGTTLYENWVQGHKYVVTDMTQKDIRGSYNLSAAGVPYSLKVSGSAGKPSFELKQDTVKVDSKFTYAANWLAGTFTPKDKGTHRLSGQVLDESDAIKGRLVLPNGTESSFTATKSAAHEEKEKEDKKEAEAPKVMPVTYPNMAYGAVTKPQPENILFKNATVWTNEADGILENTDVLVRNGKISKVGKDLSAGSATVVDATGKHLTAGIIDEHTHIGALSVNEAGHNSSAEVRMYDVVDPEDINIYRNLAGGVTAVQLLHGSANPIGGRSAILRLKWGEDAEGMHFEGAPKVIKFALGEHVKQSNWQSFSRFPQTRMGVEQVFMSYFQQAKEYDAKKKAGQAVRYDEELEVLAQILNKERFISCHSYVQSEINMLMKVAEKFNFRVNTFTHILEGYKVADKMAEHGVGGSTFSDWWAYKYEVNDAIPYNAAIMNNAGVTVAINSDDREMSRRLNQEAAKTVKYGGVSEEDAWKMVTLNPAKLLHLDDRVGSIKEGKDADVVLWTDHPLSVYARAEKTLIQGAVYFDMETDKKHREAIKKERSELIGMMLDANGNGSKTQKAKQNKKPKFECETL